MQHWVSFYSYKGGVGRSTALVNSAVKLAMEGRTVVIVDFDTEAPGLHYWYEVMCGRKFEEQKDSLYTLFVDVGEKYCEAEARFNLEHQTPFNWSNAPFFDPKTFEGYVVNIISKALVRVPLPKKINEHEVRGDVFLLPCRGQASTDQPQSVIDWLLLFGRNQDVIRANEDVSDEMLLSAEGPGYLLLRSLRRALAKIVPDLVRKSRNKAPVSEYVLADMRTGWTFSSYLLTIALSDTLVCITSRHKQSVDGVVSFLSSQYAVEPDKIIPVISPLVVEASTIHQHEKLPGIDRLETVKNRLYNAALHKVSQNRPHGVRFVEVVEVPFDVRLAICEGLVVTSDEDVGAPSAYRRLATRIRETHPAEARAELTRIQDATEGVIDDHVEIRERNSHFEKVLYHVAHEPSWEERIVLFGGISSHLSSPDSIKAYGDWLCRKNNAVLYICYESSESALTRSLTLDPTGLDAEANTRERMARKHKDWENLPAKILASINESQRESVAGRIAAIELTLPLTQYVIIADSDLYLTPLTEKRSTKSCSILIQSPTNPLRAQTLDFLLYHLRHINEATRANAQKLAHEIQYDLQKSTGGDGD